MFYEDDINWCPRGYSFSTVCTSRFLLECQAVSIVLEENRVWFSFKTYMFANHVESKWIKTQYAGVTYLSK